MVVLNWIQLSIGGSGSVCFYGCCDGVSLLWESIAAAQRWGSNRLCCCWLVVLFHDWNGLLLTSAGWWCCIVWYCCVDDVQSTVHNDGTDVLMNDLLLFESIGEETAAFNLNLAVICFFHLVRRFWNQVLIWTSVNDKFFDNSIRLLTLKYLSTWLRHSNCGQMKKQTNLDDYSRSSWNHCHLQGLLIVTFTKL